MRHYNVLRLAILLGILVLSSSVAAEIPGTMNYQGRLTDQTGLPVTDGPHDVVFKIYDDSGSTLWQETHGVVTSGGYFSVELGSNGSPLTPELFDSIESWLGISVDSDPEIAPRTRLNSLPYAFRAGALDGTIESGAITDGPGVAAYVGDYYMYLEDSTFDVICSLTIACPSDGYVLAVAHGRIATLPEHINGTDSYAMIGLSDIRTDLPGNQNLDFHIDSTAPTGTYSVPFGMTSMFTVPSAGEYTYYMIGFEVSGAISIADMQFNLVYFPTAYGQVDPVPPPVKGLDSEGAAFLRSESTPENVESLDIDKLRRELRTLQDRIDSLQRQVDRFEQSR